MGKARIQAIRGMKDMLPNEAAQWQDLESICLSQAELFGFELIRTPMVEVKDLFVRSVGEGTDVVTKEMYTFEDRNGVECVLRPEGTAACVRAGIEHNLLYNQVRRLCYLGPMFRRERPQKGRYRQFHTFGAEVFGVDQPTQDVELILLGQRIFEELGVADKIVCHINCLGSKETQQQFASAIQDYFAQFKDQLDEAVLERLEKNPLRVCDSKDPNIIALLENAPVITDFLDEKSATDFKEVCELLDKLNINYHLEPKLVRGLDYYSHVVFEWLADGLGAQAAVGGGGRYNQLVEELGGKATPAAGFGLGLERLLLLMDETSDEDHEKIYIITLDDTKKQQVTLLAEALRNEYHLPVIMDHTFGSEKAQMKKANQANAKYKITVRPGVQIEARIPSSESAMIDADSLTKFATRFIENS